MHCTDVARGCFGALQSMPDWLNSHRSPLPPLRIDCRRQPLTWRSTAPLPGRAADATPAVYRRQHRGPRDRTLLWAYACTYAASTGLSKPDMILFLDQGRRQMSKSPESSVKKQLFFADSGLGFFVKPSRRSVNGSTRRHGLSTALQPHRRLGFCQRRTGRPSLR